MVVLIDDTPMKCQGEKPESAEGSKPKKRKKKRPKEGEREKKIFQAYLWAITNTAATGVVYRFTTSARRE